MKKTKRILALFLACAMLLTSLGLENGLFESFAAEDTDVLYYKDDFEGDLNWEIIHTSVSYYALNETTQYSPEAASDKGDADGNAFWGIQAREDDTNNHALNVRKHFDSRGLSWAAVAEDVIAVLKDGILPENYGVKKASVKMYYAEGDTAFYGMLYSYADKNTWKAAGFYDPAETTATLTQQALYVKPAIPCTFNGKDKTDINERWFPGYFADKMLEGDATGTKDFFAPNQWLNLTLEYDAALGCYTYSIEGTKTAGGDGILKMKLEDATMPLTKVGLLNRQGSYPRFDDVEVWLFDAEMVDAIFEAKISDSAVYTLENEDLYAQMSQIYDCLSETQKSKVTKKGYLNAFKAALDTLYSARDDELVFDGLLNFEADAGEKLQDNDALCLKGYDVLSSSDWGTVENPKKDGLNTSSNVLKIAKNYLPEDEAHQVGLSTYTLKSTVYPGDKLLSNVTGKIYIGAESNATYLIYDYQDVMNWSAFRIFIIGNQLQVKKETCVDGVHTLAGGGRTTISTYQTTDAVSSISVPTNSWVEFELHYELFKVFLNVKVLANGKEYTAKEVESGTLAVTAQTSIAFATSGTTYLDDIKVQYQGTNADTAARLFLKKYDSLLQQIPIGRYASVNDKILFTQMKDEYEAFATSNPEVYTYLPFMDLYIAEMDRVFAALPNTGAAADRDRELAAKKEATDANTATGENFTDYVIEDDFDNGLSLYQSVYADVGDAAPEIVNHEAFGGNVLKLTGNVALTFKDGIVPDLAGLKSVTFRMKNEPDTALTEAAGMRFFYNFNREVSANVVGNVHMDSYTFYLPKNAAPGTLTKYSEHYGWFKGRYSLGETNLNFNDIWTVTMKYNDDGGTPMVNILIEDESGHHMEADEKYERDAILVLGNMKTSVVYMDDVEVTYETGTYAVDDEISTIIPYYKGNVLHTGGDYVTVQGENLGNIVEYAEISQVSNGTDKVGYVSETSFDSNGTQPGEYQIDPKEHSFDDGNYKNLRILQTTERSIKFQVPKEYQTGIYALRLSNFDRSEMETIYINRPKIDYIVGSDGAVTAPGKELRVVGRNLSLGENKDKVRVVLKAADGREIETKVTTIHSNHSISVLVPDSVAQGFYELYLYNGYGDNTCWAEPKMIEVAADVRSTWPQTTYNVKEDFGAVGDGVTNDTPAISRALAYIDEKGGGTLYVPAGDYVLESTLFIPEKCRIVGEDVDNTSFYLRPYKWHYNEMPSYSFILTQNAEIANISIISGRSSGIFGVVQDDAINLYFTNLFYYTAPTSGPASAPHGTNALVSRTEYYNMTFAESNNPIIHFLGGSSENVQIRGIDTHIEDSKSQKIVLCDNQSGNYWQVDNMESGSNWYEAVVNNSLWENSENDGHACGIWGNGLYMANMYLHDTATDNRELYVADRGPMNADVQFHKLTKAEYEETIAKIKEDVKTNVTKVMTRKHASQQEIDEAVQKKTQEQLADAEKAYQEGRMWLCDGLSVQNNMVPGTQIEISGGQGAGQTRTAYNMTQLLTTDAGGNTHKRGVLWFDRVFTVEPNANSVWIVARPRENITFYNIRYENGAATGFYGGGVDVVWDSCDWKQVYHIYNTTQTHSVNWYMTYWNGTFTYKSTNGYDGGIELNSKQGLNFNVARDGFASGGILVRGCHFDGLDSNFTTDKNKPGDYVLDKNVYANMETPINFTLKYKDASFQGFLIVEQYYQNVKNTEPTAEMKQMMKGYNTTASPNLIVIYEDGTMEPTLSGDVNMDGRVTVKDATYILYYVIGKIDLSYSQKYAADADGNGEIDLRDSMLIKQLLLGKIDYLPVDEEGFVREEIKDGSDDSDNPDDFEVEIPEGSGSDSDKWTEGYY